MHPLDLAPFAPRLALSLLAGALTWWAALGVGCVILQRIGLSPDGQIRWPLAGAAGYAAIGCLVAMAALAHAATSVVVACIPVACLAVSWQTSVFAVPRAAMDAFRRLRSAPALDVALLSLTFAAVLTSIVAAALPAVWWDPIAYHLPIAAAALRTHMLAFDAAMTQSVFPLLAECAALPAYAIAGASGAAMATLGSGIALAWLCGAAASALAPRASALTISLVACTPLWLWLAPSFYVDIPYALFAVAALALPLVVSSPSFARRTTSDAAVGALSGLFAGCAAAVKYPGLGLAAIAFVTILLACRTQRARCALLFVVGFVVIAGGWYLRALLATGDPLYPFLTASLGTGGLHDFARRYVDMTAAWCGGPATLGALIALPWNMLVDPGRYCGDPGYALRLGAVIFVAGLLAWKATWRPALLAALLTLSWFAASRQDRFIIPALCMFAIAVAVALEHLPIRDALRTLAGATLGALSAVAVLAAWLPSLIGVSANSLVPSFGFIAGSQSAQQLLSERLETYDAASWLRSQLRPGDRVLAIDDVRDYYLDGAAVWANPYYQPVWSIDWTGPTSARYAALMRAGFRYAIVDLHPAYLGRTPTGLDIAALNRDIDTGVLHRLYSANDVEVVELPSAIDR